MKDSGKEKHVDAARKLDFQSHILFNYLRRSTRLRKHRMPQRDT